MFLEKNEKILLIILSIILLTSFALRFYDYNPSNVLNSSDEAGYALHSIYFIQNFFSLQPEKIVEGLFFLLSFAWGYGSQLLLSIWIFLLSLLGIPLLEFLYGVPLIFLSALTPLPLYFLVKELHSRKAGLIAASFLAVLPWHVHQSRNFGQNETLALFLLITFLYFFVKALKEPYSENFLPAGFFLGLYIVSDNQFLAVFPLLLFSIIAFQKKKDLSFIDSCKNFLKAKFLFFPIIFFVPLIIVHLYYVLQGNPSYGFLGHLNARPFEAGFFILPAIQYTLLNSGLVLSILLLFGLFYGAIKLSKIEKESLLTAGFILYIIPYLFFVSSNTTVVQAYLLTATVALIALTAMFFSDLLEKVKGKYFDSLSILLLLALTIFFTLLTTTGHVFGTYGTATLYEKPLEDLGAKALGYYIRENYSRDTVIFSDLEPTVSKYYFGTKVLGLYDSEGMKVAEYFDSVKARTEVVAVSYKNISFVEGKIPSSFYLNAIVKSGEKNAMFLYSKKEKPLIVLDSKQYNTLFEKKYANISSLYIERVWEN